MAEATVAAAQPASRKGGQPQKAATPPAGEQQQTEQVQATEKQATEPAQEEANRRAAVLTLDRFMQADAANQRWVVNAEASHTPHDIMNPAYFAHVAARLTIYDDIEVRAENGDWIAMLKVTSCGDNWARVKVLAVYELKDDRSIPTHAIEHYVDWKGPHYRYCVIRRADGAKISTGHATRGSAVEWMREHERTLRRQ